MKRRLASSRSQEPPPKIVSDGQRVLLDSEHAGDEPYMLATNLPDVVVLVDKDRVMTRITLAQPGVESVVDQKQIFDPVFAVLNRAVSVFDAVTGVRSDGELARAHDPEYIAAVSCGELGIMPKTGCSGCLCWPEAWPSGTSEGGGF